MARGSRYRFEFCVTDPGHFVNRYINYAKDRTDAPWDYHEAQALMLLSIATQGILWHLPAMPGGLSTNLYILNHGRTSKAKKSTAMKIAKEIQRKAMPGSDIPENFTPGALEEVMADHNGRPSMLWADEFNGHLERMHHQSFMAGLRSFLLTMYGEREWTYKRVNKGKNKTKEDMIRITDAHLCISGNTTPAIVDMLTPKDIDDGFLARFGIIWPQDIPSNKGLREMKCDEKERDFLVDWLKDMRDMVIDITDLEARNDGKYKAVVVEDEAYDVLDDYQVVLSDNADNNDEQTQSMTQRLCVMAMKISIMLAVGRPGRLLADHITITGEDAEWAVDIVSKWEKWAELFVSSMRKDTFQREIDIAAACLAGNNGRLSRTFIARRLRLSKYKLDELQLTMVDRGLINLREEKPDGNRKPTMYWLTPDFLERERQLNEELRNRRRVRQ